MIAFYLKNIMKIIGFLFLSGMFASMGYAKQTNTPEDLVLNFQKDYFKWNNYAYQLDSNNVNEQYLLIEKEWNKFLSIYTLPNFAGESIAYGSESSHDPNLENITSIEIEGTTAKIRTLMIEKHISLVYEYHLICKDHRWYLTQVYYVDDDSGELYPGL